MRAREQVRAEERQEIQGQALRACGRAGMRSPLNEH